AREGLLEGFRRGGRVLVTRRSVEQLLRTPTVAAQQAYERELGEVLDAFDPGERPLPELGLTTAGRKPWESSEHVRAGTSTAEAARHAARGTRFVRLSATHLDGPDPGFRTGRAYSAVLVSEHHLRSQSLADLALAREPRRPAH